MTKLDINTIITRYLKDEATSEEISLLFEWVKKEGNQDIFKNLVKEDYQLKYDTGNWNSEIAFDEFLNEIKSKKASKGIPLYRSRQFFKYAAAILVLVASTTYFLINSSSSDVLNSNIDDNEISLQLYNGRVINIYQNRDTLIQIDNEIANISLKDGILYQQHLKPSKKSLKNNLLKVPYGKTISVSLEDGSTIKLNSGSQLSYPSSFSNESTRQVALQGEGYFEIAKNPLKPFIVKTEETYTRVYGTVFNISSYEDDEEIEVVLVEGSVGVGGQLRLQEDNLMMLKPSQKITNSKRDKNSLTIQDVDVTPYVSWVEGVMSFEEENMSQIIRKLERRFNVSIINENKTLDERHFTGAFDSEDIESILKVIKTHTNFNYVINGKTIIINKTE
ncbi:FecR family protein [Maribacter dokdonensis]|uniref:FecR family protein n=1 Tax=Maribacter dokdonensis TaxID=320912 RepID=UPI0007199612|nr:FecR domain-containing protein [Maribacter dokdonensis]KSA13457.1 Anti-FecI sigma factor, FecR [Maribacter dokdonensis DSW-8]